MRRGSGRVLGLIGAILLLTSILVPLTTLSTVTKATASGGPTCSVAGPANGATLSGMVTLGASPSSDATTVELYLNGADLGPAYKTEFGWLYSANGGQTWGWDTASLPNATDTLTCIAAINGQQGPVSQPIVVQLLNQTGCSVTEPSSGATVSGSVTLDASAPYPQTTAVEFYLHTAIAATYNIGPGYLGGFGWLYSPDGGKTYGWNTQALANGTFSITCEAEESTGPALTSGANSVVLNNAGVVNIFGANNSYAPSPACGYPQICVGGANGSGELFPAQSGQIGSDSWTGNPIANWQDSVGQTAWEDAVDPTTGAVFTGYLPQSGNEQVQTSANMYVSVFDPQTQSQTMINIPTSTGDTGPVPTSGSGGADTNAMTIVPDSASASGHAALFVSAVPYPSLFKPQSQPLWDIGTYGQYPTIGKIIEVNQGGHLQWTLDSSSALTGQQILSGSPDAAITDPNTGSTYGAEACPQTPAISNGQSVSIPECGATTEVATLPYSGDIVAVSYLGKIMVLSPSGNLLAAWQYQESGPESDYWGNTGLAIGPRNIKVEPANSTDGNESASHEKFVVTSDVFGYPPDSTNLAGLYAGSQEFAFDQNKVGSITKNPITAVSHFFTRGDIDSQNPVVVGGVAGTTFDQWGDLWATRGSSPDTFAMFKSSDLRVSCAVTGTTYADAEAAFADPCNPTTTASGVLPGTTKPMGTVASLTCDCGSGGTGAILATSSGGASDDSYVMPIMPGTGSPPKSWSTGNATRVGLSNVAALSAWHSAIFYGAVDSSNRRLWLPIGTAQSKSTTGGTTANGVQEGVPPQVSCPSGTCSPVGMPNPLVEVNLGSLLGR